MTEKKKFEKPEIRVIELQHRTHLLLAGSAKSGQMNNPEDYLLDEDDPFDF